jgi:membrane-associated phospholipid phosphatase
MTDNKILSTSARITSIVFHPLLIPTLGFLLLFTSGFYFTLIPWSLKRMVLMVVFLSTCLLPAVSIGLLGINQKIDLKMDKNSDRILPLILSSIFYYAGYMVLQRLPIFPIYKFFLVASILVQIALLFISMMWKISAHSAAIGGLLGGFLAMSFLFQENPLLILTLLVLFSGMVGTSRLILEKHTNSQVYSGFLIGFLIMISVFLYI